MRSSLAGLIIALLALTGALGAYVWWYHAVTAKSTEAADLSAQIVAKSEAKTRIAAARAALDTLSIDEVTVQDYFVSDANVVSFLAGLQASGRGLGTQVSILSVSSSGSKAHPALSVSLQVAGSFDAVMRTVGAIEYAPYAISVQALSLSKNADTTKGAPAWGANLTLSVGSSASSTAATAPSTPTGAPTSAPAAPPGLQPL